MFDAIDMLCVSIYCHIHVYGLADFKENEDVWKRGDIYQLSAKELNGNQMTVDSLAALYHHFWIRIQWEQFLSQLRIMLWQTLQ
jgi:hypothetical protein